ncbi:hypothetical protein NMY22_g2651 [Coprinellus aureogranulatus]|nr:hypothetical protein NMY22_g2651 [Coprinellus aureogranulatus]
MGAFIPFPIFPDKVQTCILRHLPLSSAVSVSKASKECYRAFKRFVNSQVADCFAPFDLPKDETLAFMREQKAIASGSAVLKILNPNMGRAGDLDLYIPNGTMGAAHAFLTQHHYYLSKCIERVRYYTHTVTSALVNIIETSLPSAPTAVFMFHSTVVMNYLTWNTVVCAYPLMTFAGYSLLNSSRFEEPGRVQRCIEKYQHRGYSFVDTSLECQGFPDPHMCGDYRYCGHTERHVGDSTVMRLTLEEDPLQEADVIDPGLKWLLSCRRGLCGSTVYDPYGGWVETADGTKLYHTATTFAHYSYHSVDRGESTAM